MNNREEKINALLLDNRFVDWVINPQSPYAEYWLQWLNASAENAALAEEARSFLLELRSATENEAAKELQEGMTEQMLTYISKAIAQDLPTVVLKEKAATRRWYWVAAAVMTGALVFLGITFFRQTERQVSITVPPKEKQPSSEVARFNGSEKNELVFLPDGSRVTLAKGARISYNRLMNGKKRKVSLNGEAFFDVAKNADKPFYICTKNMIIKVLGTSFRVTASEGKESVVVKTGKVSVYLKGQDPKLATPKILLPKQVCTYSFPKKELITTTYTSKTKIEIVPDNRNGYNFEDAPLSAVLQMLEKMYSLPVHYDRSVFKDCFITISLEHESLEEKLEVITKTIGASFSISEYGISIEGTGCK